MVVLEVELFENEHKNGELSGEIAFSNSEVPQPYDIISKNDKTFKNR